MVAAIDALSRGELDEWKQEFQTSVSSLQAIGNAGLDQVKSEIKAQVDAAVANSQKGFVALTVTGVAAPVEVTIDDTPPFASNILSFTLPPLTPGVYRLRLTGKNAAAKDVEISAYLQVPAGISSHAVAMDTGVITAK